MIAITTSNSTSVNAPRREQRKVSMSVSFGEFVHLEHDFVTSNTPFGNRPSLTIFAGSADSRRLTYYHIREVVSFRFCVFPFQFFVIGRLRRDNRRAFGRTLA